MTLKQIEYFQTVCAKGNISAAAEALFLSRSVVSRAIAELEEEFGTQIFTRSKNGVALTESGTILAQLFKTFTASYATAKGRIGRLRTQEQTRLLRLGVTPTNAYCIYHTYLEEFQCRYPQIRLYIEEYSAYDAWRMLLNGRLDAFFTPVRPDPVEFDALELYPNPIMLGVAAADPLAQKTSVSIADILDLPLGFFNAPMPIEATLKTCFQALGRELSVVIRTSDQMLLKELTRQGKLYPILPLDMMATWEEVRQVPLDFFHPSTNRLVWSRGLYQQSAMEPFLTFMRQQTRQS